MSHHALSFLCEHVLALVASSANHICDDISGHTELSIKAVTAIPKGSSLPYVVPSIRMIISTFLIG